MLRKCAITLTIKPEYYKKNAGDLYIMLFKTATGLFNKIASDWSFCIEITNRGIPHLHGTITPSKGFIGKATLEKSWNMKFQNYLLQNESKSIIGHSLLKWIHNEPEWEDYMLKESDITSDYLSDNMGLQNIRPLTFYSRQDYLSDLYDSMTNKGLKYPKTIFHPMEAATPSWAWHW